MEDFLVTCKFTYGNQSDKIVPNGLYERMRCSVWHDDESGSVPSEFQTIEKAKSNSEYELIVTCKVVNVGWKLERGTKLIWRGGPYDIGSGYITEVELINTLHNKT